MIGANPGFAAASAAPSYGVVALAEMAFRSGTARFTTWPLDIQVLGETWKGVGTLGNVSELHESEDGAEEKITLTLSPVDVGMLSLALGDPADYQDRSVRIWIGLLDAETLQPAGAPVLRFAGVMDQAAIERDEGTAAIRMHCRTASYDVRSNPAALRMNNAQHTARYPGERGFEYLNSMIGSPTVWVNKHAQVAMNYFRMLRGG